MMKKWLAVGGVVLMSLVSAGGLIWWRNKQVARSEISSPVVDKVAAPTPTVSLANHADPAGFTIQYPQSLSVNPHDEDKDNYAHFELTDVNHPGGVIYWVKDLPSKVNTDGRNLATWVAQEKRFKGGIIADTTIGGQMAKKVLMSNEKTSIILAVFDGVLFEVQVIKTDNEYWSKLAEQIIGSTKLVNVVNTPNQVEAQNSGTTGNTSDGEIIEEEEVIE